MNRWPLYAVQQILWSKQKVYPIDLNEQRLLLTEDCDYRYAFEHSLTQAGAKQK
ncbi:hypothetical protein ACEQPO_20035 [Bacillus sp. SL00103]